MTKFASITIDALLQIKRNSTVTFTNLGLSLLFSLLLNGLGRVYLVLVKAKLENQQQLDTSSLVSAQQQLILLLTIFQVLTAAALLTATVLGTLYYSSLFMKHFLTVKEEFAIMKYLGASSGYVAFPLFLETWLTLLAGFGLGTKFIRLLYQGIADNSGAALRSYLIQPVYFIKAVELPVMIALTLISLVLTLRAYQKIETY